MENNKVFINPKSGSIRLTGTVELVDADGKLIVSVENPKFCGCGHSQDKPWCDGSHKVITVPVQNLLKARESTVATDPFSPSFEIATQIRRKSLQHRLEENESLVGLKIGGAIGGKEDKQEVMIFGFLTDAMQISGDFICSSYLHPQVESEIVFKIGKDISSQIELGEVTDYVSHVAAGMEIFDFRYGDVEIYSNDAIADNAGAAAFAHAEWIPATKKVFDNIETMVWQNSEVVESTPITSIQGDPWKAIVRLSEIATAQGVVIKKNWIIFSGSATNGVVMTAGNTYTVDTPGIGKIEITAH